MKSNKMTVLGASLLLIFGLSACSSTSSNKDQKSKMMNDGRMQMMEGKKMGMMSGEKKMMGMMMTPEMHEKMAKKHQKSAKCLRSGKTQKECMPMMGMGKNGMMKSQMMKGMDHCMSKMKGKKMNNKGMGKMKMCMMQQMEAKTQKMSDDEHKKHH